MILRIGGSIQDQAHIGTGASSPPVSSPPSPLFSRRMTPTSAPARRLQLQTVLPNSCWWWTIRRSLILSRSVGVNTRRLRPIRAVCVSLDAYFGELLCHFPRSKIPPSYVSTRFLRLGKYSAQRPTQWTTHHKEVWKCFVAYSRSASWRQACCSPERPRSPLRP